ETSYRLHRERRSADYMGPGTELASNSFGVDSGERSGPAFTRLRAGRPNFGCYATPRNQPMSRWNSVPNLFKTANSPSWLLVIWRLAKRKPRESSREESRFHQLSGVKSPLQCAGINRHEVEDERALRERSSDPLGPESCTATASDTE